MINWTGCFWNLLRLGRFYPIWHNRCSIDIGMHPVIPLTSDPFCGRGAYFRPKGIKILRLTFELLLLLGLSKLGIRTAHAETAVTFTNAEDIHRLSREASLLAYPVKLKGVVTYSDPSWNVLFIRDASAGVFIDFGEGPYPTNAELVEITGRTEAGSFLPVVAGTSWRHLGSASMPEPRRISQPERFAAEIDCEWSDLVGVVRRVTLNSERNHLQLDVVCEGLRTRVFVPVPSGLDLPALNRLIDARVSVLGVTGVEYDEPRGGIKLKSFAPSVECIRVLEQPPVDPFLLSVLSLSKVTGFGGTNLPGHRVHVRGIATYWQPSGELVLQEDNSALRVLVSDTNLCKVGDALEAVGFISPGVFTPVLEDASIRTTTAKLHAEPAAVGPATVLWGNYDARLVCLRGTLQNDEITKTNHILTLLRDGVLFGVSLHSKQGAGDWPKLKKSDCVRVTGVCTVQGPQRAAPQSFQVLLRSPGDAVYVPRVREFSAQQVLTIVAIAAAVWGMALLWGVVLRRRVHERTSELANSLSLLNATIESTADGILVVDRSGRVAGYNTTFARMWHMPIDLLESKDDQALLDLEAAQLKDGEAFLSKVRELYATPEDESFDTLEFKDGRVFERYSQAQRLDGRCVGRVWCFRDVTARKQADARLASVHHQLLETSRRVGMAEVATAVLHNVGNVLNSVNVSATLVNDRLRRSRANNLAPAAEMIEARMDDLEVFLTQDPKGQKLRAYLKDLSLTLVQENEGIRDEVQSLRRNIEHIKAIVAMQQSHARVSGTLEKLDPSELMENAIQINGSAYETDQIRLLRDYQPVPPVLVDRHKVLQILINLLSNARHALESSSDHQRHVRLSIFPNGSQGVCLRVSDNGTGIEPENLSRIFNQGFTTRKDGHGFGLHSGAIAAKEMNGALSVQSDGHGKGAVFTLELPVMKDAGKEGITF